ARAGGRVPVAAVPDRRVGGGRRPRPRRPGAAVLLRPGGGPDHPRLRLDPARGPRRAPGPAGPGRPRRPAGALRAHPAGLAPADARDVRDAGPDQAARPRAPGRLRPRGTGMAKASRGAGPTAAVALLARERVAFTVHEYAHDPAAASYGLEAAAALGRDPDQVFKTLLVVH